MVKYHVQRQPAVCVDVNVGVTASQTSNHAKCDSLRGWRASP